MIFIRSLNHITFVNLFFYDSMPVLLAEKTKQIERTYHEDIDLVIETPSGFEFRPTKTDDYSGFIVMVKTLKYGRNQKGEVDSSLEDRVYDFVRDQDSVLYLDNTGDLAISRSVRFQFDNFSEGSDSFWIGVPFPEGKTRNKDLWDQIQAKGSPLGYRKSKWCV